MMEKVPTKIDVLRTLFLNDRAICAIFFLVIQQLIVASSTIWISDLSGAIIDGKNILIYLALFVTSLFVVYIPGIISSYYLEKAKNLGLYRYIEYFSRNYKGNPTLITEKTIREEREPWLIGESGRTIEEVFSVGYDGLSTGLNTSLNILALCYVFGIKILLGYGACVLILPIISRCYKNNLRNKANQFQADRKSMYQSLLSSWDNITAGNQYNFLLWWRKFNNCWEAVNKSSVKAVFVTQLSSVSSVIFLLVAVMGNFFWIFLTTNSSAKLAALVATLPRQIQILQHFEILSSYVMLWHGTYTRLKNLLESLDIPATADRQNLLNRVKWNEIIFEFNHRQKYLKSFSEFIEILHTTRTGRLTIRGANGTGKTTLINLAKQELGDNAFYLPTNSQLIFESTLDQGLSTGQKVKAYLDEISKLISRDATDEKRGSLYPILLLDEWSANLDIQNATLVSEQLESIAKSRFLIEISHRQINTFGTENFFKTPK